MKYLTLAKNSTMNQLILSLSIYRGLEIWSERSCRPRDEDGPRSVLKEGGWEPGPN